VSDPIKTIKMKITIIYDNTAYDKNLIGDFGFACLVEAHDKRILFDTGAKGPILLSNMRKLDIDPESIDEIFISHDHWDHQGGLGEFLKIRPVRVYVPSEFQTIVNSPDVIRISKPIKLHDGIYSTSELKGIEYDLTEISLAVQTTKGIVVVVGCSHPLVGQILDDASQWGDIYAIVGGLHGFTDFEKVKDLELICATHCTKHKSELKSLYPDAFIDGGAGRIIEIL
jgi:7,8-dihydropterin-6-yl-methyl-4-(beta-D-ribofuranosyl)aminobenzene 5'-phosphate synthase